MAEKPTPEAAADPTATPEFQAALKAEVAKIKAEFATMQADLMAEIKVAMKGAVPAEKEDMRGLISQLAMSIAEINDQGSPDRKRIDPKILQEREAAMHKMGELILLSRNLPQDKRPRYQLVAKTFLKERLVEPFQRRQDRTVVRTEIVWCAAPNSAMRPVNDSAKKIFDLFTLWIGGSKSLNGQVKVPQWVTEKGTIMTMAPTASAQAHNMVPNTYDLTEELDNPGGEELDVGGDGSSDDGDLIYNSPVDPTAPEVHVLGTVAAPARRMDPAQRKA